MFTLERSLAKLEVSTSCADSISVSRADSVLDDRDWDRRHEWTATTKAPIDTARAMTDANDITQVIQLIAAHEHVDFLWTLAWQSGNETASRLRHGRKSAAPRKTDHGKPHNHDFL